MKKITSTPTGKIEGAAKEPLMAKNETYTPLRNEWACVYLNARFCERSAPLYSFAWTWRLDTEILIDVTLNYEPSEKRKAIFRQTPPRHHNKYTRNNPTNVGVGGYHSRTEVVSRKSANFKLETIKRQRRSEARLN